jgi:hypothetical protein
MFLKPHLLKYFTLHSRLLILVLLSLVIEKSYSQSTLYSEDFNNSAINHKGFYQSSTLDLIGVTNWTIQGTPDASGYTTGDWFAVVNNRFESMDTDPMGTTIDWLSTSVSISGYTGVAITLDIAAISSFSSSGVIAWYELNNSGTWIQFGNLDNTTKTATNGGVWSGNTLSVGSLSGSSIKLKVGHYGTNSAVNYYHDNVRISGVSACLPTLAPTGLSFSNINSQSLTLTWTAGNGDKTIVVASPAALSSNPASGTSYMASSVYGSGSAVGNGYVVFNGLASTTSTVVTGLDRNTNYTFTVFTYNSSGNCYLEPGTASSQTTANLPIALYVDNNSNTNDVYTLGSANGSNAANGKKLTPWATLTYALTQIIPGDTIYVDAGTYTDNALSSPVGGAHIIGAGMAKTIFNNPSADSYFMRIDDNNTTLSDMTLRDYNAQTCGSVGGQVLGILGATGVKITNVLIDQASTSSDGCGYPIEVRAGASVIFQGGGSTCNNWFAGGGIHVSGATTSATINNYLFYGNRKDTQNGSALHVDDGTVVVRNSKFDNNESRSDKRGAGIFQQSGNVTVYDCWFDLNETWLAYDQPGGTILISGGTFTVKRSKFTNHTQGGGSTSYGSAIGITSGTATIDSCYFSSNSGSTSRGTDVYNDGGTVTVRNSTFLSTANQIGSNSGTMSLSNSGSPSAALTVGLTFVNHNAPTYTANPSVPQFTGVCGSITILPVELLDFDGACELTHTHLWWSTASEHNNDHFTIDRAGMNGVFYPLATVSGKMNTTERSEYSFADYYAEPGVNYYRLSQTDVDGKDRIMKTISVDNNCLTGSGLDISCWYDNQNNSVEIAYLFEHRQILDAQILNMMGQVVATTQLVLDPHDRTAEIQLSETFSNGMYFLRLSNNSIQFSEKFMIGKQ